MLLQFWKWELLVQDCLRSWPKNSNEEIKLISAFHDLLGVVFPHYNFLQINTRLWRHFWSAGGLQSAGLCFAATALSLWSTRIILCAIGYLPSALSPSEVLRAADVCTHYLSVYATICIYMYVYIYIYIYIIYFYI